MRNQMRGRQVPTPRLRSRAIAIPAPLPIPEPDRVLALIHFLLALLAPFLILSLTGCEQKDAEAVDYGPETDVRSINKALVESISDSDLSKTKLGAYVYYETTDDIAGGQSRILSSTINQTVVERAETADTITFYLQETKRSLKANGKEEVLKREFELPMKKDPPSPTPTPTATPATKSLAEAASGTEYSNFITDQRIRAFAAQNAQTQAGSEPRVSYHRLRKWDSLEAAPDWVRRRPNCLGLANCQVRLRHVAFDFVVWDSPQGDVTKLELVVSPDAPPIAGFNITPLLPFLPGLYRSCITQLVAAGDNGARTLVTECQSLSDFLFEQAPQSITPATL